MQQCKLTDQDYAHLAAIKEVAKPTLEMLGTIAAIANGSSGKKIVDDDLIHWFMKGLSLAYATGLMNGMSDGRGGTDILRAKHKEMEEKLKKEPVINGPEAHA